MCFNEPRVVKKQGGDSLGDCIGIGDDVYVQQGGSRRELILS